MTPSLPALVFTEDLLPNSGPLNGRRWVSQLLFRLWLDHSSSNGIDLLVKDFNYLDLVKKGLPSNYSDVDEDYLSSS